jgi:hypothetical protein
MPLKPSTRKTVTTLNAKTGNSLQDARSACFKEVKETKEPKDKTNKIVLDCHKKTSDDLASIKRDLALLINATD